MMGARPAVFSHFFGSERGQCHLDLPLARFLQKVVAHEVFAPAFFQLSLAKVSLLWIFSLICGHVKILDLGSDSFSESQGWVGSGGWL